MAGAMAFIGHCYPVWLRFAGGKGVATMMGVVTALYWPAGIVFAVVWLGALFGTKWSSVGGMAAAVSAPRSEEHTSELQSLMRISYAVFCLKKKKKIG